MEKFDFSIEHRPGTRHGNADALSRRPCPKRECLCQQPVAPLFSGSVDPPVSVSAEDREDSAVSNPQLCRSTRLESKSGQDSKSKKVSRTSPLFSGPADRGRPHIQRRYRLWCPAIPPSLETITEEDDFVGEFIETELNPEAEPFVPVREVSVATIQVESSTPVDPPATVPNEPYVVVEPVIEPWSTEGFAAAQKADPDIGLIYQLVESGVDKPSWNEIVQHSREVKTLWSFWPRLSVRNGLLQRKFTSVEQQTEFWQTVIPKSHRQEFMDLIHSGSTGGHFGVKKTSAAVQSRAYWPSWSTDIESYVKRCSVCAQYHRGALPKQAALQTPLAGEPWERVSIDITGPHPKSCLLYTSPSPRDRTRSRMPSSA